ncbi:MAG: hypothetical protein K0R22_1727, partial [Sporomusa sp.]|nr:hypothetical protein [Sporomusa sp.]
MYESGDDSLTPKVVHFWEISQGNEGDLTALSLR